MDRKRRLSKEQRRQSVTVPSIKDFSDSLEELNRPLELASVLDVYCVYASFLRDGYVVDVEVSGGQFYTLQLSKSEMETEIVIPVGFSYPFFTLQLLVELIGDRGHVSLAWVAEDGSFTIHEAVHGIIPPKEKIKDNKE